MTGNVLNVQELMILVPHVDETERSVPIVYAQMDTMLILSLDNVNFVWILA